MPTSGADNNFHRFLRSHGDLSRSYGSRSPNGSNCNSPHLSPLSPLSPSSPVSTSPNSSASITMLRRNFSSTFSLIPEEEIPIIEDVEETKKESLLYRVITWYPFLVLGLLQKTISTVFSPCWGQMLVVLPTLWISACLWIFWKSIQCPLAFIKWFITVLYTPASERNRKKRTVLISGGSTVQTLHLARNFYCSGARVVVVEVDGLFGLSKYSTAVDKFYTIARPNPDNPQNYIKALCEIVEFEKVNYYVPVSSSTSAYFDAIAKPHLEVLGCSCFIPGIKEVAVLDDVYETLQRCHLMGKPTPNFTQVTSMDQVDKWYENPEIPHKQKHFMASSGIIGVKDRIKFLMPKDKTKMRSDIKLCEGRPWVIVQDMPGEHYLTCTTVKDSQVVTNVTCKIDPESKGLIHEENKEINSWLKQFFMKLQVQKTITGHVSFRFVKESNTGIILPLGCKVGVSLPYICHTSVHPRLLWKPCPHFNSKLSGPTVAPDGRYWMPDAVLSTLKHPGVEAVSKLIGTVLDKREALFVYWDPLPYCAYYHIQLPLSTINQYVQKKDYDISWINAGKGIASVVR